MLLNTGNQQEMQPREFHPENLTIFHFVGGNT